MGVNAGYDGYTPYTRLTLADNCQFVFGGDVCDRGPGELVTMWLVMLCCVLCVVV